MRADHTFRILFALWAAAFVASISALLWLNPVGEFQSGLNLTYGFFGWQAAAGLAATLLWMTSRRQALDPVFCWLRRLPIMMFVALAFASGIFAGWSALTAENAPLSPYVTPMATAAY